MKNCTTCGEQIEDLAIKCKFCMSFQNSEDNSKRVDLTLEKEKTISSIETTTKENRGVLFYLFSFNGRIGRLTYFLLVLPIIFLTFFLNAFYEEINKNYPNSDGEGQMISFFILVILIILFISHLSISTKRMKDIGIKKFFIYLINFIFILPLLIENQNNTTSAIGLIGLVLLFQPGQKEDNEYGKSLYTKQEKKSAN